MKFRAFSPILAASLALTLGVAACGSSSVTSKVKSSLSHAASSHGVTNTSAAKAKIKSSVSHKASSSTHTVSNTSAAKAKLTASSSAAKAKMSSSAAKYKAGEFCSSSNASAYKAQHFECVDGHLKSTSTTKSSTSK